MQLVLSPLAQTDLEAIGDYIALDSKPIEFEGFKQLEAWVINNIAINLVAICESNTRDSALFDLKNRGNTWN